MKRLLITIANILMTLLIMINVLVSFDLIDNNYTPWWVWVILGFQFIGINYDFDEDA